MSKVHRGHFDVLSLNRQRWRKQYYINPLETGAAKAAPVLLHRNETDRPVLFDNQMEAPAGGGAPERSIYLPGVQEVRKAKRSSTGTSRGATPELPGIRVVSVESGLTLPDLSRKNASASLGRPLTDRNCAGTKNAKEGRERRWILARFGTTENRGHSDGMTASMPRAMRCACNGSNV